MASVARIDFTRQAIPPPDWPVKSAYRNLSDAVEMVGSPETIVVFAAPRTAPSNSARASLRGHARVGRTSTAWRAPSRDRVQRRGARDQPRRGARPRTRTSGFAATSALAARTSLSVACNPKRLHPVYAQILPARGHGAPSRA